MNDARLGPSIVAVPHRIRTIERPHVTRFDLSAIRTAPVPANLSGAQVLIWGIGSHGGGLAAAAWCAREGASVCILDRHRPADLVDSWSRCAANGWTWHLGQQLHPVVKRVDLIVASPAIPPRAIARLPHGAAPLVGADALFFARHQGPRVAITGTKGKSTTAHMTGRLLDWQVGGNSHTPLLDLLLAHGTDFPVVCELSSFQLSYLSLQQPRFAAAAITLMGRDHLDWHRSLEDYHDAKRSLLNWAPVCYAQEEDRPLLPGAVPPTVHHDGTCFRDRATGEVLCEQAGLTLPGEHNARNADLALSIARRLGSETAMLGVRLSQVQALPHRLECVHRTGRITYVNDSVATTPEATIVGMQAIEGPLALILGGRDKGADYRTLARAAAEHGTRVVLLAGSPNSLSGALHEAGVAVRLVEDLPAAVAEAVTELGRHGGTVLFSPACASAPPYHDFAERGEHFRRLAIGA